MAYERIEGPIGRRRDDYHAALIAATIANASRRGKRGKRYGVEDFLLKWDRSPGSGQAQSPEEMLRAIKRMTRAMGGDDRTKGASDGDARRPRRSRRGRDRRGRE